MRYLIANLQTFEKICDYFSSLDSSIKLSFRNHLNGEIHITGEKSLKPHPVTMTDYSFKPVQVALLKNIPFSNGMMRMHFIAIKK